MLVFSVPFHISAREAFSKRRRGSETANADFGIGLRFRSEYEKKAFEPAIGVLIYTWLNDPKESPSEMAIICEKMFKGFSNITYITKNV